MSKDDPPRQELDEQLCKSLGKALKRARARLELTQEDVAEMLGISTEYYARMERGHALPSVPMFHKMVLTLGVSANEFLGLSMSSDEPLPYLQPPEPPQESRLLRSVLRRVRKGPPERIPLVTMLVNQVEQELAENLGPDDDEE